MTLHGQLQGFFLEHGFDRQYYVGFSGGLDSYVLLHLAASFPIKLTAIHVNHQLHEDANQWAQACKQASADLTVPFIQETVQVTHEAGASLEQNARQLRYQALAKHIPDNGVLLTAHHQDDQAETLLLQLMRGSGAKGLSAMPVIKPFEKGFQARPLLSATRKELHQYAVENDLSWIEDSSNQNIKLSRNYVRHEVMPTLKRYWPGAIKSIARSASHLAEAQVLLEDYAKEELLSVAGSRPQTVSVKKLSALSSAKQRLLLRMWIQQNGYSLPSTKKLQTILTDVLAARWDAAPHVTWQNVNLRRHRDDLHLTSKRVHRHDCILEWTFSEPLVLPNEQVLVAKSSVSTGMKQGVKNVSIRFRKGGEAIDMPERGKRSLKQLLQEWQVLPWLRDSIPLLYIGEELVAVIGHYCRDDYLVGDGEAGWVLTTLEHQEP